MANRRYPDITGVILVGGKSRRMGRDKAFLPWKGRALFEEVLSVFNDSFKDVLLVGDDGERFGGYGCAVVPDIYPGSALGGLYTGVYQARTDYVFVAPCDMPYPSRELLHYLCSLRNGYDAIVPEREDAFEPLYALYAKSSLRCMKSLLEGGNLRIYDLYPMLRTRYVGGSELERFGGAGRSLVNVNTPEEVAKLFLTGEDPLKADPR